MELNNPIISKKKWKSNGIVRSNVMSRARSYIHSAGPHIFFTVRSPCLYLRGNSSLLGTNVIMLTHSLKSLRPFGVCRNSIDWLGKNVSVSTWIFGILTRYCHIGSHRGKVPTQVRAGRLGSEGGVGREGPSRMKMWSSPRPMWWAHWLG